MAFKCPRWTFANTLPVAFVIWVIGTIWILYCWLHLLSMLQLWTPRAERNAAKYRQGWVQVWVSQTLTALLATCLWRAVYTDPGSVPETADWLPSRRPRPVGMHGGPGHGGSVSSSIEETPVPQLHESKQTGERRFCKWCNGFKPDRCHHCRVCKSCILRMDHHCPWIANCVGFRNHKYFFLLVFYALLTCGFIIWTMSASLYAVLFVEETPPMHRFLLVFGMTLTCIMTVLLFFFFVFHVRLMLVATTTIEFCEKRQKYPSKNAIGMPNYSQGLCKNLQAVLGPQPLLWLLPVSPPQGDGLTFLLSKKTSPPQPIGFLPGSDSAAAVPLPSLVPAEPEHYGLDERLLATEPERVAYTTNEPPVPTEDLNAPEVTGEKAAAA